MFGSLHGMDQGQAGRRIAPTELSYGQQSLAQVQLAALEGQDGQFHSCTAHGVLHCVSAGEDAVCHAREIVCPSQNARCPRYAVWGAGVDTELVGYRGDGE